MTAIREHLKQGKTAVYDADLSKYFDTIPHDKLQIALKQRIADPRILKLVNKWLKVSVYEDGQYKSGKGNRIGTPHGHCNAQEVATGLNTIVRGWLNYFEIKGISYPAMSKRKLRRYLHECIYRYYNRKSQRKCRLYGQKAFEVLVTKFGLIDPSKYANFSARL
jgi:retron-type reverse transcriptase